MAGGFLPLQGAMSASLETGQERDGIDGNAIRRPSFKRSCATALGDVPRTT